MELEKILQQFKDIRPDEEYAASSKRAILAMERPAAKSFGVARFIFSNVQSASAIALTSFLLILIFGGFSVFQLLNPLRLSSLDPVGLRAEADAIDMQLHVTAVAFDATQAAAVETSTAPPATGSQTIAKLEVPAPAAAAQSTSTVSASTTPVSVDSALDILSN